MNRLLLWEDNFAYNANLCMFTQVHVQFCTVAFAPTYRSFKKTDTFCSYNPGNRVQIRSDVYMAFLLFSHFSPLILSWFSLQLRLSSDQQKECSFRYTEWCPHSLSGGRHRHRFPEAACVMFQLQCAGMRHGNAYLVHCSIPLLQQPWKPQWSVPHELLTAKICQAARSPARQHCGRRTAYAWECAINNNGNKNLAWRLWKVAWSFQSRSWHWQDSTQPLLISKIMLKDCLQGYKASSLN